jgi:hypothetical protein
MRLAVALALALAAPQAAPTYDWKLTPTGWGPVRIGMNRAQVEEALKVPLEGDAFDNEGSCVELYAEDAPLAGVFFMFQGGKLSRITASEPSKLRTPKGIAVGAADEAVRKAYGAAIEAEPHRYSDAPAEYLTVWLKPKASGVRFETDAQGKVETIHAGGPSIELVEGCS